MAKTESESKKSILILTNNIGGLHSFRREVVKAIVDDGYTVIISAPDDDVRSHYFEGIGCQIIKTVFKRRGMNPLADLRLLFQYWKLIRHNNPKVVLTYTIKPNVYGGIACRLSGVPQLANVTGLGDAIENGGWLQSLTISLYRIGLAKAKSVFFQNQANKSFCESHGMVKGASSLIPGSGVNLQFHSFQVYPSENPIKFIFIGRLLREKGIDEYLGAAERVKSLHPEIEFHVLGACEEAYEEKLRLLQEKGIVIYHDVQPDVRSYIGMCHCTIHPSFYPEGMSNVLLESCATGRPIITTNRPGCGEIVEDGMTGFLVKAKNTDDLVRVIERFIDLPYPIKMKMGQQARNKVEKEFDRRIVVDAYLKEINRIMR